MGGRAHPWVGYLTNSKTRDGCRILLRRGRGSHVHFIVPDGAEEDDEAGTVVESSIYKLGRLYADAGRHADLTALMSQIRPFFDTIPKAKTAKIVRTILDMAAEIEGEEAQHLVSVRYLCAFFTGAGVRGRCLATWQRERSVSGLRASFRPVSCAARWKR